MKKLLALLFSMIMAVSLVVPAFAAPAEVAPGYIVDGEPAPVYTPGDAIPISAILDESIGVIGGADGPTAIITGGLPQYLSPDDADGEELERLLQELTQEYWDELKESLGGVAGQIGLMVNGAYIKFPDAAPEASGGRTMIPVRALVEALGGDVGYQDGVVTFELDGYRYKFAIGSTAVTVSSVEGGEKLPDIVMDCAPYAKDGRTYVPIRFIAETLGYEVGWDGDFQTAILLDRAALAERYDKDFTIMNKVQANRVSGWKQGETLSTDVKGNVTVTAFDTLNGNKTYKVDFSSQTLMNTDAASGSFSIRLSDNIAVLLVGQYGDLDEETLERMNLLVKALEDAEFIMNRDGRMWIKSPALDELAGEKNVWCGMEMDDGELQTVFANSGSATVGEALAAVIPTDSVIMGPETGMLTAVMELYRDEHFTTSGGVSTLTLGLDDLAGVYEAMGGGASLEEAKALFKTYEITIKVDRNGGATIALTIETAAQLGVPGIKAAMKATQSDGRAELTMDVHAANIGELKLALSTTQRAVSGKPMSEPPAGASVTDAPALLDGYGEAGN